MKVVIESIATTKLILYSKIAEGEIGGYMDIKIVDGDIIVQDIILLKQVASGASFELDEEDGFEFLSKNKKKAARCKGWWHSHVNMAPNWSPQDDETFELMTNINGFALGIVTNKQKKLNCKVMGRVNGVLIIQDKVDVEVESSSFFDRIRLRKKLEKEVEEKVAKETYFNEDENEDEDYLKELKRQTELFDTDDDDKEGEVV
ncbi:MAG: hypothetical protein QQN41_09955 [Nitrosopumilus sp.]